MAKNNPENPRPNPRPNPSPEPRPIIREPKPDLEKGISPSIRPKR